MVALGQAELELAQARAAAAEAKAALAAAKADGPSGPGPSGPGGGGGVPVAAAPGAWRRIRIRIDADRGCQMLLHQFLWNCGWKPNSHIPRFADTHNHDKSSLPFYTDLPVLLVDRFGFAWQS